MVDGGQHQAIQAASRLTLVTVETTAHQVERNSVSLTDAELLAFRERCKRQGRGLYGLAFFAPLLVTAIITLATTEAKADEARLFFWALLIVAVLGTFYNGILALRGLFEKPSGDVEKFLRNCGHKV